MSFRQIIMIFISILFGLLLPFGVLAQDSESDLKGIFERFNRTVNRPRDYCGSKWPDSSQVLPSGKMTAMGSKIDSNCFKNGTAKSSEKILEKANQLQALAVKQATRCKEVYNSESLNKLIDDAIKYMKEAQYTCPTRKGNIAAAAGIEGFGEGKTRQIVISDFNRLGSASERSPIGLNYSKGFNDDVHEGAAILFHEGLHFTESDNTQWHSHPEKKNTEGCNNSLFEDRVYFIEAACFPLTPRGRNLFIQRTGSPRDPADKYSAADCPDICQSALKNVDTSNVRSVMEFLGRVSAKAKPFPASDIKNICHEISEVRDHYRNFLRPVDIFGNINAALKAEGELAKVIENKETLEEIRRKMSSLSKLNLSLLHAGETGEELKVFSLVQYGLIQLKASIANACRQAKEDGSTACGKALEMVTQNETMIKSQMSLMTSPGPKIQKRNELLSDY